MLELKCDRCGAQLKQPGALVFSPPAENQWLVEKHHLCVDCWATLAQQVFGRDVVHRESGKEKP